MSSSIGSEGIEHPGAETLAAFVDGRLKGRERRRIVEHLDACPDCYEEYAETVRFLQDEKPGGRVVAIGREDRPRSWRPLFWTAAAIAAVLVAAVVVPGLLDGPGAGGGDPEITRLASALDAPDRAVDHLDTESWPSASLAFSPGSVAMFDAGVAILDLRVALLARDRGRALAPASALARRSSALIAAIEHERWEDAERKTSEIERSFSEGDGADDFLAGGRAEAGRLAAATGDTAFFRSEPGRAVYEALAARLGEATPAPDDLEALEEEFAAWIERNQRP